MDDVKLDNDIKTLLDGDAQARPESTPVILETRASTCAQHGNYTELKIPLRSSVGLKPVLMPYWMGCPECRRLAEAANKLEEKRWSNVIPGEPSWSNKR